MAETDISHQLQHDFPGHHIWIDAENQAVCVDDRKNVLLLSSLALQRINIFSASGRHFYEVIVNLIYTRFEILPEEGSYADSLIIKKEDVRDYKIKKLAELYKLGFLEDDGKVMGIAVDDGVPLPLMLEDNFDDLLDDDSEADDLQYYRYSFWRDEDPEMEELEIVDDEESEK